MSKKNRIGRVLLFMVPLLTVASVAVSIVNNRMVSADAINSTDFVITIDTTMGGNPADTSFTIPTEGTGYNYTVDCNNDGAIDATGVSGNYTCNYPTPGQYTIRIGGTFPRIYFDDGGDDLKLMFIDQWGDIQWSNMERAFRGTRNMDVRAVDTPDLSNVTHLKFMFESNVSLKGEGANWNWNTSSIRDTTGMFYGAGMFNQNIGSWNTDNVRYAGNMFAYAIAFNNGGSPSIANWNMSNAEYVDSMFEGASSFNQPISSWNLSSAVSMARMLAEASSFNQSLADWRLTALTEIVGNPWSGAISMLDNTALSLENYDATLISWSMQNLNTSITLGADGLKYCRAESARTRLVESVVNNGHNWTINGDAKDCPVRTAVFDAQSGSNTTPSQLIAYNDLIAQPADPVREGYIFEGWFADSNYTTQWNFASDRMPNGDMTLYAKWRAALSPGPVQPSSQSGTTVDQLADTGVSLPLVAGVGVAALIAGAWLLIHRTTASGLFRRK